MPVVRPVVHLNATADLIRMEQAVIRIARIAQQTVLPDVLPNPVLPVRSRNVSTTNGRIKMIAAMVIHVMQQGLPVVSV